MSRKSLGKVIPSYVGIYDSEKSYDATDIVTYESGLYMCCKPASGLAPGNAEYWSLLLDFSKLGGGDLPDLAKVATTGSYNDLSDKPEIPTLPELAPVATSGSYNDLIDKPETPGLPELADVAYSGSYNDLADKPELAAVATSGNYNDLSNKPAMPTLAPVATTGSYNDLTDKPTIPALPSLAAVATSGSYDDLSNRPDLSGYVPVARTVNGKELSANIALSAADVGALPLTGGTMTGTLIAASTAIATSALRNSYSGTTELTSGVSPLPTGVLYYVYE